jgi:exodeoxyribonuclease VII small subunit
MPKKKVAAKPSQEKDASQETAPQDAEIAELDFETATSRLETIVRNLEEGKATLEESLRDYETGVRLLRHCHRLLEGTQRKILQLSRWNEDGTPEWETLPENHFQTDSSRPGRARRAQPE